MSRFTGLLLVLCLCGCATTSKGGGRPMHVEVTVNGVDETMAKDVQKEMEQNPSFRNVTFKGLNAGNAVYEVDFSGDATALSEALTQMKKPSLKQTRVSVQAYATAADTEAPPATLLYPAHDQVLLKKKVSVLAQVEGHDVKEVLINGIVTRPLRGTLYKANVDLIEGVNEVAVAAVDQRGNRSVQKIKVTVDSTPITASQHEKVAVGGSGTLDDTFLVEGSPATLFTNQTWRVELMVPKGTTTVDVVKMDKLGHVTVLHQPVQR